MKRRTLLLLAAPALLPQPASAQAPVLARIEAYLNRLTTLEARFLQITEGGGTAMGTALIWRPGRMRFDYDPPEPTLLVAASGQMLLLDRQLRQPTIVPVGSTPLSVLLRDPIRLSGEIEVTGVEESGGFLRATIQRRGNPGEGRITLVFAAAPMELRQWLVVDNQARETRVTLSEIRTGGRFDPALFEINDPRFLEREIAR
ncbi:LolA family protein [Humitalea rosea]|uniref:LolA family protein n=1 Tax=Humitalea rosea TaxID=990373 RepID=UPI001FE90782|nr:outer membrane lipoprotein carrier protein LolA [Humitalea rosea]